MLLMLLIFFLILLWLLLFRGAACISRPVTAHPLLVQGLHQAGALGGLAAPVDALQDDERAARWCRCIHSAAAARPGRGGGGRPSTPARTQRVPSGRHGAAGGGQEAGAQKRG